VGKPLNKKPNAGLRPQPKSVRKNGANPLMCLFPNKHRKEKRHARFHRKTYIKNHWKDSLF
jgi:hypothetical protein